MTCFLNWLYTVTYWYFLGESHVQLHLPLSMVKLWLHFSFPSVIYLQRFLLFCQKIHFIRCFYLLPSPVEDINGWVVNVFHPACLWYNVTTLPRNTFISVVSCNILLLVVSRLVSAGSVTIDLTAVLYILDLASMEMFYIAPYPGVQKASYFCCSLCLCHDLLQRFHTLISLYLDIETP